jgi:hypothetical protein
LCACCDDANGTQKSILLNVQTVVSTPVAMTQMAHKNHSCVSCILLFLARLPVNSGFSNSG